MELIDSNFDDERVRVSSAESVALMHAPFLAPLYVIVETLKSVSVVLPVMRRRGDVVAVDVPVIEIC